MIHFLITWILIKKIKILLLSEICIIKNSLTVIKLYLSRNQDKICNIKTLNTIIC